MSNAFDPALPANRSAAGSDRPDRRARRLPGAVRNPRVEAAQFVARHRLDEFERSLYGLAVSVFGDEASVVAHLRQSHGKPQLTFVVDAADPSAGVDYAAFLPREEAFWTAYAHVPKPPVPFAVAIRPARGWCRTEALAPLFAFLPAVGDAS